MTQEEILEYNKKCAEFLGWELQPVTALHHFREGSWKDKKWNYHFDLKFHSDWNWIMEVVEAIEKLDNFYVQIEESACYIYDISKFTDEQCNPFISCDLRLSSKKEAVVTAINQFLIWYNENKL